VLTFHFRGSWGSPGAFSITHELEDTQAALDFVRSPAAVAKYGVDAKAIVLIGHSIGGLAAAIVGARNPDVRGVATISAVDLGGFAAQGKEAVAGFMSGNMDGVTGTSPIQLADEIVANRDAWTITGQARALASRPLLVVTADDGLADASLALGRTIKAQGGSVTDIHLAGDHAYSGQRIALETAVLTWLETLRAGKLASPF
jgi:pimeloyl-ACP methyl ester carboxylesterase